MHLSPDQTIKSCNIRIEQPFDYSKNYYGNICQNKFFQEEFVPRHTDVIIGKGIKAFSHVGNKMLRDIIASRQQEYDNMETKKERSDILSSIVAGIRANGFFLKKDTQTSLWFEADEVLARDKISQSFRRSKNENHRAQTKYYSIRETILSKPLNSCDRVSSISSIDLAKTLLSCVSMQNVEDSDPYEPIPISEAFNLTSDNIPKPVSSNAPHGKHNTYEVIPYRCTS